LSTRWRQPLHPTPRRSSGFGLQRAPGPKA
jgi:hypothetical protein